jgi:hypothetical protein
MNDLVVLRRTLAAALFEARSSLGEEGYRELAERLAKASTEWEFDSIRRCLVDATWRQLDREIAEKWGARRRSGEDERPLAG